MKRSFRCLFCAAGICSTLVVLIAGCDNQPQPALRFASTTIELGEIPGTESVDCEFPFEVAAAAGITIARMQSTCKCTAAASSELGRQLSPGEKGIIRVSIGPQDRSGKIQGTIHVVTEPPSAVPIMLNVNAVVPSKPEVVGQYPVPATAVLGQDVVVEFDIALSRAMADKPLQIDAELSKLSRFVIDSERLIESKVAAAGAQVEATMHEIHRLRLRHPPLTQLGDVREELQIAWKGLDARTPVPLAIAVSHPLQVVPANTFLGFVKPTEKRTVWLSLATPLDPAAGPVELEPGTQGPDAVEASFDASQNRIQVTLTTPDKPGRFVKSWNIRQAGASLPPFSFSITGLVE